MVACLRYPPLILRALRNRLKLIVKIIRQLSFVGPLPQLLIVIHPVDSLSLVSVLHQQVGVVIRLLSVEVYLLGPI